MSEVILSEYIIFSFFSEVITFLTNLYEAFSFCASTVLIKNVMRMIKMRCFIIELLEGLVLFKYMKSLLNFSFSNLYRFVSFVLYHSGAIQNDTGYTVYFRTHYAVSENSCI